ncbi:hypothetical protein QE375_001625 [Microbacterium foliorum]|uniref:Uncharacterized protein n=1 Tax=Microbacterium foliorum TaxID=104336 RepID=A0ABU1HPU7_9MICO|nr:hypothetical protein [Microbacterium foliorum]MDR6142071.1 hypothetical protein [Microbacterium foliorum]
MSTPNIDDVATTVAEYENLAISTGAAVRIDPPEFSADGSEWSPFWLGGGHPVGARATVHRDGVATTVYVSWEESFPAEESWRGLWLAKPMKLFGAYVVRAALRRAFRDAIGDRREPDEQQTLSVAPDVARDWEAEIAGAADEQAVMALHAEMKQVRAVTVARERALRARLGELSAPPAARDWEAEFLEASTTDAIDALEREAQQARAFTADTTGRVLRRILNARRKAIVEAAWALDHAGAPAPAEDESVRPATRDHLPPQNRAARRASSRKKGRR